MASASVPVPWTSDGGNFKVAAASLGNGQRQIGFCKSVAGPLYYNLWRHNAAGFCHHTGCTPFPAAGQCDAYLFQNYPDSQNATLHISLTSDCASGRVFTVGHDNEGNIGWKYYTGLSTTCPV